MDEPDEPDSDTAEDEVDIYVARRFLARCEETIVAEFHRRFAHNPPIGIEALPRLIFNCAIHHLVRFEDEHEPEGWREMDALIAYAQGKAVNAGHCATWVDFVTTIRLRDKWEEGGWLGLVFSIAVSQTYPDGDPRRKLYSTASKAGGLPETDERHAELWTYIAIQLFEDLQRNGVDAFAVLAELLDEHERGDGE